MNQFAFFADTNLQDLTTVSTNGDFVVREGIIWRCGDYTKTHGYAQTPEQLADGMARFQGPVSNEYIHLDTEGKEHLLEGEFGITDNVKIVEDGKALFARVSVPKWFDNIVQRKHEGRLPVSAVWKTKTHDLVRVGFVKRGGVPDAAVFGESEQAELNRARNEYHAAKFRFETQAELDNIDEELLGDITNKLFPARTQDEFRDSMRELANAADPSAVKTRLLEIAEAKGYKTETPWYQTPGISKSLGSDCLSCYSDENPTMKFFIQNKKGDKVAATSEEVVAFTQGVVGPDTQGVFAQEEGGSLKPATPEQVVAFTAGKVSFSVPQNTELPADVQAKLARLAQFEQGEQATFAATINQKAEAHYAALLKDNKVVPAEKEAIVAAFTVAEQYDAKKAELAYFAADDVATKNFSMAGHLDALYTKRSPHKLTTEEVAALGSGALAVFDAESTTAKDPVTGEVERVAQQAADAILANRNRAAGIVAPEAK